MATKDGGGGGNDGIDKSFLSTARIIDVPLIFIVSRAAGGNGYKDFSVRGVFPAIKRRGRAEWRASALVS